MTDYYLQVKNSSGHIYAMGDCCTIEQRKLLSDVKEIFTEADKDSDGKLSLEEFKGKPRNVVPILSYVYMTNTRKTSTFQIQP